MAGVTRGARAVLVLAAVLLVAGAVAPVLAAPAGGTLPASQTTADFLYSTGDRPENTAPGVRAVGKYRSYQLVHFDANYWWVDNPAKSPSWSYLQDGETIERNQVWVRSKRAWGAPSKNLTFNVVYSDRKVVTRTTNNTTETETVARNVTVQQVNVTVAGGVDRTEIPLQPMFEKTKRVTIWLDGKPNVKWVFAHHSNYATVAMGHIARGEFTMLATGWLGIPILVLSIVSLLIMGWAHKKAAAGPQIHPLVYFFLAIIIVPILLFLMWARVADVVSRFPILIGLVISLAIGGVGAWLRDDTFPIIFIKPKFRYGRDGALAADGGGDLPDGVDQADLNATVVGFEIIPKQATYTADHEIGLIPNMAPIAYLARLFGAINIVEGAKEHTGDVQSWGPYRHVFVAHPESESALDYQPEGFAWGGFGILETVTDANGEVTGRRLSVSALAMLLVSVTVPFNLVYLWTGGNLTLGVLGGLAGLIIKGTTTRTPKAAWEPAPVEMADPLATMFNTLEGIEEVTDARDTEELWLDEKTDNSQKRQAFEDSNDLTVIAEMAQRFGIDWRQESPGGAASIANDAVESEADD